MAVTPHHPPHSGAGAPRRILVADDNEQAREQLKTLLEAEPGVAVDTTGDGNKALEIITSAKPSYSILLTDLKMPGRDGINLIEEIRERSLPVTVIVMTGFGNVENAVQAMRLGAYDFLKKPIDTEHLQLVVKRALRERALQDEVLALREQSATRFSFHNILSKSPQMHSVFELISNVAHTSSTVLIQGETGTGKEMVAQAIHQSIADVRPGPFVPVNCAALPETLLESELFGHEKGAFTGAIASRVGRFEMANGGTLFLDEVGEIPLSLQAKLLRVLQERRFERVGGSKAVEVDVRLVAATNRPLGRLVKKGKFRDDLYYRINVVPIELPPLRDRREDIPLLAAHFATQQTRAGEAPKTVAESAMEILLNYHWPGNVRELANIIERACVVSRGPTIEPEHLPPELTTPRPASSGLKVDINRPLGELMNETTSLLERQYIKKAMEKAHGNVSRCAKLCGLSRRTLTAKLAEYKIDRKAFKLKD
jgi:two-component system response regulator AtoC